MRILYDSKQSIFKSPFGTLVPNQVCNLHLHIPATVRPTQVSCIPIAAGQRREQYVSLLHNERKGP